MTSHRSLQTFKVLMKNLGDVKKNETKRQEALQNPSMIVASHAVLDSCNSRDHGINQPLVFPNDILNVGGGYHKHSGLFVAPTGGIYVLSVSLMTSNVENTEASVCLAKNGNALARAYGYASDTRTDQGAVNIVVQLVTGDTVHVKFYYSDDQAK